MLIHGQDVAQAAIERSLLINCRAACRLVDELHHIHADADDVRISGGEQCKLNVPGYANTSGRVRGPRTTPAAKNARI